MLKFEHQGEPTEQSLGQALEPQPVTMDKEKFCSK